MFRPLAWTKTLAVGFSSVLAITLVPVLMVMLIRGRLRPERANPISRITQAIYLPILRFCLHHRWLTIVVNLIFLVVTFPLASRLGSQFMPALFEGSTLYMPIGALCCGLMAVASRKPLLIAFIIKSQSRLTTRAGPGEFIEKGLAGAVLSTGNSRSSRHAFLDAQAAEWERAESGASVAWLSRCLRTYGRNAFSRG